MTSTGTLTLKIIEGGYLQGKVKDANGDPLTSFQFTYTAPSLRAKIDWKRSESSASTGRLIML